MRQYGQFCPIAKALDVVGDRWTLLIVRELAARPCRYTDLRDGLPGIATNLLADRLKSLDAAGVITAEAAPPPVATTLYRLTERGEALLPALAALGLWGAPLLADANESDEVRSRWLVQATRAMFAGIDVGDVEPLEVALDVDDEPITLSLVHGQLHAELGPRPTRTCASLVTAPPRRRSSAASSISTTPPGRAAPGSPALGPPAPGSRASSVRAG